MLAVITIVSAPGLTRLTKAVIDDEAGIVSSPLKIAFPAEIIELCTSMISAPGLTLTTSAVIEDVTGKVALLRNTT
jgi:hypothetical protein